MRAQHGTLTVWDHKLHVQLEKLSTWCSTNDSPRRRNFIATVTSSLCVCVCVCVCVCGVCERERERERQRQRQRESVRVLSLLFVVNMFVCCCCRRHRCCYWCMFQFNHNTFLATSLQLCGFGVSVFIVVSVSRTMFPITESELGK